MSMASYGRMLVEASLRKKRAIVSTQCQRLPSAKDFLHSGIDHNQKVKEWLVSCDKLEEKEPLNKDKPATEEKSVEDKPAHKGKQLDQEELPKDPEPPEVEVSDEREQPSDEDSGENEGVVQSSGSEYKPSECSDSEQKYDYVAASIASECSEIYPMLQNSGELPLADSELNVPGNDLMPLRSSSDILADATENQLTTPTPSQLKRAFANVTVAGDAKISGKRSYRKPDYCLFCKGMYMSKISAHYLSVHTKESKVKDIMDLPCGSKERKRLLSLLQNEGNHLHNCDVLRHGCGEITVSRRPSDRDASRPELYVPCTECKAWIFERSLSTHSKSCPAGGSVDKNLLRNSKMLISPFITLDYDEAEIEDLIIKMSETSKNPGLKDICMNDVLIKEFCRGLLHKIGSIDEQRRKDKVNIRTKLRTVARLSKALNENSKEKSDLMNYITPKHFMFIVETVKKMSKHSPNLALTLGHYLKQLCQLKQSLALQKDDENAKKESDGFNVLFSAHWNSYVSAVTLRRQKLRTLNKSVTLPKTTDMVKLKQFLDSEITDSLKKQKFTYQQWSEIAQALMVRILLFNKRRVSEVEEMKVSEINKAENGSDNEEILSHLDITEKALANRMTVIEVRGKSTRGLRKVFVILSRQMLNVCQHLILTRMQVGIDPSNDFMFARPCGSTMDGCKAMRDLTLRCPGLEHPELIRTRLLRKYLATTIQLLDMTGDELKMVADHMGHSVAIHTDVYRMQTSILEKTKVARALIALENGQLNKFAGRHLSSCSLEELPVPIAEPDGEQNIEDAGAIDVTSNSDKDSVCSIDNYRGNRLMPLEKNMKLGKRNLTGEDGEELPHKLKKTQTRKRWDKQEEENLLDQFKEHIISKRNPSASEIRQAQEKFPCLKERSVAVIKTKVNNIILGKCKGGLS